MVKDTRSSVRARYEEKNNPKRKQNGDKVTREISLKKKVDATPPKSTNSERLSKQSSSTPSDIKKHGTVENQNMLNPLRGSERCKMQSSSTPFGSGSMKFDKRSSFNSSESVSKKSDKSPGSPNRKRKREKKEKSIEQSTLGNREAKKSSKHDTFSKMAKSKRMDARAYRAFIREKLKKSNSSDTYEAQKHTRQNSTSLAPCEDDSYFENRLSTSSLIANDILKILDYKSVGSDVVRKLIDLRKTLHHHLKPEISKLCQILKLPEHVKHGVEKFFEYIMDNHLIFTEPATTTLLQAFQLSLCWTAASMLEYKIDHKESLALAKKHLNLYCRRQEVYFFYSRLRCLKKIFSKHLECYKVPESSFASESPYNVLSDNEFQKAVVKSILKKQKTCRKKFEKLKQKQQEEKDDIIRTCDEEKSQTERQFRMESAVIRTCLHNSLLMRQSKLQVLETKYAKKLEEHKCQMEIRCKKLEEEQSDETNNLTEMEAHWVNALTSWLQVELLNKQILNKTKQCQNSFPVTEHFHGLEIDTTVRDHLPEECRSKVLHNDLGTREEIFEIPGTVSCEAIIYSSAVAKGSPIRQNGETAALDTVRSHGPSATEFEDHDRITSSNGIEGNLTSEDPFSVGNKLEGVILGSLDKEVSADRPNSRCSIGAVDVLSIRLPTSEEQIFHSDKEVPHKLTEAVGFIEGSHRVLTVPLLPETSSHELNLPISEAERVPDNVNLVDVRVNISASLSTSQEFIPISEVERLPETVNLADVRGNISASQSSRELIPNKSMVSTSEIEIPSRMNTCASSEVLDVDSTKIRNDGEDLSEPVNPCVVKDTTGNADPDINSHELSVASLPLVLAVTPTPTGNGSLLFNQAAEDEMNLESSTAGSMDYIMQATEMANANGETETPIPYVADQSSQEEHNEMNLQSPCNGSMDDVIQTTEMVNTNGDTEAPISYFSNHSIEETQAIEPRTLMVPLATNSSVGFFQADLSSAGGMEHLIDREDHSSNELVQSASQPIQNPIQSIEEVLLQPVTCTAAHSTPIVAFMDTRMSFLDTRTISANFDISNGLMQPTQPSLSQTPSLLYIDPLEKELENLRKEIEQNKDVHTKMKQQLQSEYEKELEEVTAQIQKKYEISLQESETKFDLRKKGLDVNYNKVLLNKILAEALRLKDYDTSACDIGTSVAPQILQLSHLQNSPGSPSVANLSINLHPSICSTASTSMHVHHVPTNLMNSPMRPPHISSISSPTGNPLVGNALRAPAPHLQPFRPTSSISTANPVGNSIHHNRPSSPSATPTPTPTPIPIPPSFPQRPPRPPISAPHVFALDLLMDMNNRGGVNFPPNFPPCVAAAADVSSNMHQPVPPVSTAGNTTAGYSDVVCLSDDD